MRLFHSENRNKIGTNMLTLHIFCFCFFIYLYIGSLDCVMTRTLLLLHCTINFENFILCNLNFIIYFESLFCQINYINKKFNQNKIEVKTKFEDQIKM